MGIVISLLPAMRLRRAHDLTDDGEGEGEDDEITQ